MAAPQDILTQLAAQITTTTKAISDYLDSNDLPHLTGSIDDQDAFPNDPQVQLARMALIEQAMQLYRYAIGPRDYIRNLSLLLKHDQFTLHFLNDYDIWNAVPLSGSVSYADIATKANVDESILRRVLRYSFTFGLFRDDGSGQVAHTPFTAAIVREPLVRDFIGMSMEDAAPASVKQVSMIRKFGASEEPSEAAIPQTTGHAGFWEYISADGTRAARFGRAMQSLGRAFGDAAPSLLERFEWPKGGTVVDVGGSKGHYSVLLAKDHPDVKFVVQDLPSLEAEFRASVPQEVADRVTFQAHDFFTPQPVKDASIFLIKSVLHDWSDKYAINILKSLTPAMKPRTKVIVCDAMMTKAGEAPFLAHRTYSGFDLQMMAGYNSKERTREEWEELFEKVEGFELEDVVHPRGSPLAMMVLGWKGL